jgi:hypothetical protein
MNIQPSKINLLQAIALHLSQFMSEKTTQAYFVSLLPISVTQRGNLGAVCQFHADHFYVILALASGEGFI